MHYSAIYLLDNPTKLKELTMAPNKILIDFGEMNNLMCKEMKTGTA